MPQLRVSTARLAKIPDLSALIPTSGRPLAWLTGNVGMIGAGVATRADFTLGEDHFSVAQRWWHELLDAAIVDDPLNLPGTGLVAFGSFSFRPHSPAGSSLIVPQVLVGVRDGSAWLTTIKDDGMEFADEAHTLLAALNFTSDGTTFSDGVEPDFLKTATSKSPDSATSNSRALANSDARIVGWKDSETAFLLRVASALDHIEAGEASKVVMSRWIDIVANPAFNEGAILRQMHDLYPSTWAFAVDGLIGATPEMLAQKMDDAITLRVLAGTVPADSPDSALLTAKNLDEHRIAVESPLTALQEIGDVEVDDPHILRLPNVAHLATDIRVGSTPNTSALEVASRVHPTAALGGTPTEAALRLIDALESFDRDRYGAPVGWMNSAGYGQWAVALRCLRITSENTARAFAGGGIVAGSIPTTELKETEAKFAPVLSSLGISIESLTTGE